MHKPKKITKVEVFYMEEWTNILVRLSLNLLDITRRDLMLLFSPVVRVMIIFKCFVEENI